MHRFGTMIILVLALLVSACDPGIPEPSSQQYPEAIRKFYVGLAALQVGDEIRARKELEEFVRLAPNEPAGWVNLAILQMRQRALDDCASSLKKAEALEPNNTAILRNQFVLDLQRADYENAVAVLKTIIELDPQDVKARFALGREYERKNDDQAALVEYSAAANIQQNNVAAKVETARLAAKSHDIPTLISATNGIATWVHGQEDQEIAARYLKLHESIEVGEVRQISQNVAFLRNALSRSADFRAQSNEIRFDENVVGIPMTKPLKLPSPESSPAPPDEALTYRTQELYGDGGRWCKALYLDGDSAPVAAWGTDREVRIGDRAIPIAGSNDVVTIDINYDLRNDLVVVGESGLRFYDDRLADITANTKVSPRVLGQKYERAFIFDIEADGDLDLVLAGTELPPVALQNNADGTFKETQFLQDVADIREMVSADLDEDGDTDVAAIDHNGKLFVFSNERGGIFKLGNFPASDRVSSVGIADIDGDDRLDVVTLGMDGRIRSSSNLEGATWRTIEVTTAVMTDGTRMVLADLDNNGAIDIKVGAQIWLNAGNGQLTRLKTEIAAGLLDAADTNGDGLIDLVGLGPDRKPATAIATGTKNYGWQVLRPRAAKTEGDQRINSFGIGSEVEIRSGTLAQKRVSDTPQVHFGLGDRSNVDVMRIIWGNGYVQADFDLKADQAVTIEQRLKGSCPHLFSWDGTKFALVKDAPPWSPALGLKINAQDTYGILATEEWFKIPGEMVVPKDGFYELRITGEYWETYYIDHYSLMVVDHPDGTEIFADERFAVPIPPLKIYQTGPLHRFAYAGDDNGRDVSAIVAELDESYLGGFELGQFQGVAKEHFVEFALPVEAPSEQKLMLIADGWVHPTDASINVELGQSSSPSPKGLSLEFLDDNGDWRTAMSDLGFPAGKMKSIVVELPGAARRFRLRTNMEIYWDRLSWAVSIDNQNDRRMVLPLTGAELRYRGFSLIEKRDQTSPEIPQYETIETTTQKWRDLEGYYTRYGDVLELLRQVDDRYIISGAGDEIILRFAELPPVGSGWKRDFVIVGDGWIKDGDLNSVFSKTVLPLPTHRTNDYTRTPSVLEDDPVYRLHPDDWRRFHTRYVAPDRFRNALR